MSRQKFIHLTDLHFHLATPWSVVKFFLHLKKEKPEGIFLTGDISNGLFLPFYLELLAKTVNCPIYFVLGNHDWHFSNINLVKQKVRNICNKYSNLIYMDESGVIEINDEVAVIGHSGFYDAENGNKFYLHFTFDWFLTKDFRDLPTMDDRIKLWQQMADESVNDLVDKIEKAIDRGIKTIYCLTHIPPWKEATRDQGTFMEPFWLPYNSNVRLGKALEQVMKDHKKRHLIVLAGHSHTQASILVSRNIQCMVNDAGYFDGIKNQHIIYI